MPNIEIKLILTDEDQAAFVPYLRPDAPTTVDLIRKDYIENNIKTAALQLVKAEVERKQQELLDDGKALVIALEKQQFAAKVALVEAEYAKLPPK